MDPSVKASSSTADIDALESCGQNALHRTIRSGSTKEMLLMMEEGANFEAQDIKGRTPLHIAAKCVQKKKLKMLLKKEANVTAQDRRGQTPLHMVAMQAYDMKKMITLLMMNGASINVKDYLGRTPLHLAALNYIYEVDIIQELLNWGASIDTKDANGETPLDTAVCRYTMNAELKKHFVKLKYASLLCNGITELDLNLKELDSLKISCLKEIEIMKTKKVGRSTLIDVFHKYGDPTYIPNNRLNQRIKSRRFLSQFPIYGPLLRATYMQAKSRTSLLSKAQGIFTAWFPAEIARYILSLVTNEDLENVIKSTEETAHELEPQPEPNLLINIFNEIL